MINLPFPTITMEYEQWQRKNAISSNPSFNFTKLTIIRFFTENLLVFLLQYIGLMLTISSPFSPVWFASGTACAFTFMRGLTVLPGIWIGSVIALSSYMDATLFGLQTALLFLFCHRIGIETLLIYRKRIWLKLIFLIYSLTLFISFFLSCTKLPWLYRWLANANGILIVGCALITWDAYFPDIQLLKKKKWMIVFFYGLILLFLSLFSFTDNPLIASFSIAFILFLMIPIGNFFSGCGIIAAIFLQAFIFNLGAYLHTTIWNHFLFLLSLTLPIFLAFEINLSLYHKGNVWKLLD